MRLEVYQVQAGYSLRLGLIAVAAFVLGGCAAARVVGGPMAGPSSPHEARIWLMTDRSVAAAIEYWPQARPDERRRSGAVTADPTTGHVAQLVLAGLEPNERYAYRLLLNGTAVAGNPRYQFVTQPQRREAPKAVRLATGSCAHIALDVSGPEASRFSSGYGIFDRIAAQRPDAMLWLGDSIYYRDSDFAENPPEQMNARWAITRTFEPLQQLLQTGHHYAIWDDHDYGPNNSNRGFEHRDSSLALFRRYWPQATYGLPGVPGTFAHAAIEDVELFLLDNRFHRDDDNAPDVPGKAMFGDAQLAWLQRALAESRATFKLIVGGSRLLAEPISAQRRGGEGWHNFPHEREAFLRWLREARIDGVVMVSGDVHYTYLSAHERPGVYPLYELVCSPLTSRIHPRPHPINELPGTLVLERNFCTLEFTGPAARRELRISAWNQRGEPLWSETIASEALRTP
ncbi:MAG: alkaline phosphatase D family protein [Thiotrichales bacterium]